MSSSMKQRSRANEQNGPRKLKNKNRVVPIDNRSSTVMRRMAAGFKKYWFVAVPGILLNAAITFDHVIAKANQEFYVTNVKAKVLNSIAQEKADEPLDQTLRAHWITTNDEGNIDGRISAIEAENSGTVPINSLDVTLLQKGEKISKAATDQDGKFVLKDVKPGIYTLVAAGQNGFLAYGVNVLPKLEEFESIDPIDGNTQHKVRPSTAKRAFYVSHFNVPKDAIIEDELQIDAAAVPPEFTTLQRISQNYLPSATAMGVGKDQDDKKGIGKATEIKGGFKFPLDAKGNFHGRIQPIATNDGKTAKLTEMNVFLIQEDIEAARVAVQENGKFEIEEVDPGVYSLVAAGRDGFAALSIELVSVKKDDANSETDTGFRSNKPKAFYVSHQPEQNIPALGIAIVTDPEDIRAVTQEVQRVFDIRQQLNQQFVQNGFNQFAQPQINGGFNQSFGGFQSAPIGSAPITNITAPGGFSASPFSPPNNFISTPAIDGLPNRFAPPRGLGTSRIQGNVRSAGGGLPLLSALILATGINDLASAPPSPFDPPPMSPSVPEPSDPVQQPVAPAEPPVTMEEPITSEQEPDTPPAPPAQEPDEPVFTNT